MSNALSSGVTGLQAHQKMLDISGNNLANVNTTAFKASRITFAELLSETVKKASAPTDSVGGTNPQQMGSGVGVAGIMPNMTQGNIVNTGNPLDLALEGEGYFVLSDGEQNLYTRAGAFAVDAASILVDPTNGYRVQRIGTVGESDGFQVSGDQDIHVPFDASMPASATTEMIVSGNLSSDAAMATPDTQVITSDLAYTTGSGTTADLATEIDQLDQYTGTLTAGTISFSGYHSDGTSYSGVGYDLSVDGASTVGDLINHLNNNVLTGATASLVNGQVRITDDTSGYSRTDITMSYVGDGTLEVPGYFGLSTVGGTEVKPVNITVYDSQGGRHVLAASFVRTDTANTWDMVLTSITGNIENITMDNRRIEDITFDAGDGSYSGLGGSDTAEFVVSFGHDPAVPQTIGVDMGTVGRLDGLTQFAGNSTAVARDQDGYAAGRLSTVTVNNEGILIGAFSNGIKKDIATLQIALFQNPAALESKGGGFFLSSANSGEAMATQALTGGAGTIHGGSLEKSNADVATEFVNMIQAQNGFQANARTIRVANEVLRELTNLIR
ncbi:MAG: flagellar hook protein FlgE [Planctomycetota bacterium]|jgi:flagellar hook protein FlgE